MRPSRLSIAAIAVLVVVLAPSAALPVTPSPAVLAQQFIYELNAARWNPSGYAAALHFGLPHGVRPMPPLAVNASLLASSSYKARETTRFPADFHPGTHVGHNGMYPNGLVVSFGYPLVSWWDRDANYVESFYGGLGSPTDVLGALTTADAAHWNQMFGVVSFADHLEIGVGVDGANWFVHTAMRDTPLYFATGVVYADSDHDGRMDLGEGLGGVTVSLDGRSTTTNAGGGYALRLPSAPATIRASGAGFVGSATAIVKPRHHNVGVDFVSGGTSPIVHDLRGCGGLTPTITGTRGPDVLVGTPGADVIAGLGGNDRISGEGGDDVICGGKGNDLVDGGDGADTLLGGMGQDHLDGGTGNDHLAGGPKADVLDGNTGFDHCEGGETTRNCEA